MASIRKPQSEDYAGLRERQANLRHIERVAQQDRIHGEKRRKQNKREGNGWRAISLYLFHQRRLLDNERYFTAMYGCRTSWPCIERAALYYSYF